MKINSKEDIPNWFKLENYKFLESLAESELLKEIDFRRGWIRDITSAFYKHNKRNNPNYEGIYDWVEKTIKQGMPHLSSKNPFDDHGDDDKKSDYYKLFEKHQALNIEQEGGVHLASYWDIQTSCDAIKEYYPELDSLSDSKLQYSDLQVMEANVLAEAPINSLIIEKEQNMSFEKRLFGFNLALISVSLDGYTNKELLSQLEKLLPLIREKMKVREPQVIKYRNGDNQKIVANKIIPLIDLRIGLAIEGFAISTPVLAGVLHPDFCRGEIELVQTDIPFSEKILNKEYRKT